MGVGRYGGIGLGVLLALLRLFLARRGTGLLRELVVAYGILRTLRQCKTLDEHVQVLRLVLGRDGGRPGRRRARKAVPGS